MDPQWLRIYAALRPGDSMGDMLVAAGAGRQRSAIGQGAMTEPLPWYTGASPWGGPVASPPTVVSLLYADPVASLRGSLGGAGVGLFGAIEIRFAAGPVFTDHSYRVSGEVTGLSESPAEQARPEPGQRPRLGAVHNDFPDPADDAVVAHAAMMTRGPAAAPARRAGRRSTEPRG